MMYFSLTTILTMIAVVTGIVYGVDAFFFAKKRKPLGGEVPTFIGHIRFLFYLALVILVIRWLIHLLGFPLLLVSAVGVSGIICVIDYLFFVKGRKQTGREMPVIIDYSRSFFPVLLLVLIIRSFVIQPFHVPTGSLEPTVLPHDFLLVNQYAYGLRLPVIHTKILDIGSPKRGDIVVFRYPLDTKTDYVKRVIGVPGDHIVYQNKVLTINGKELSQRFLGEGLDFEPPDIYIPVDVKEETFNGVKHKIFVQREGGDPMPFDIFVPARHYFMMGDNRDNSADSRVWGFVPDENVVGKAFLIWLSWDSSHYRLRWSRMGTRI